MSSVLHIFMIERVVLQSTYWWLSTSRDNIDVFINSHCANIFKFLIYYLLKLSFPIFWNGNSQLLSGRLHSSTWALKHGIYLCIYPRVLLNINALDKRLFAIMSYMYKLKWNLPIEYWITQKNECWEIKYMYIYTCPSGSTVSYMSH